MSKNQFPSKAAAEERRAKYPKGTRYPLHDPYREMPSGLQGTVNFVDDTGAVCGEDEIRLLSKAEPVKRQ